MSTKVAASPRISKADKEQSDKRIDLFSRFLQAGIADPKLLPRVEKDALLFLLPDDDSTFVEQEIAAAAAAVRHGQNVYLHHVRVADLPEPTEPTQPIGTEPGTRRATYDPETGEILTNQVLGADGEWHDTEEPFPIPRDDESDSSFVF